MGPFASSCSPPRPPCPTSEPCLALERKESEVLSSVQFSCSVVSDSLRPHELQHARPPCPSPTPGVHPNSCASNTITKVFQFSSVQSLATPWTAACQASLSITNSLSLLKLMSVESVMPLSVCFSLCVHVGVDIFRISLSLNAAF